MLNYGTYTGTITEPGIHFRNCWGRETRVISTAEIAAEIPNIKVLDGNGNPIIVSAILTYKFVNSKRALLNVADAHAYVIQQGTAVLKQVWVPFSLLNSVRSRMHDFAPHGLGHMHVQYF